VTVDISYYQSPALASMTNFQILMLLACLLICKRTLLDVGSALSLPSLLMTVPTFPRWGTQPATSSSYSFSSTTYKMHKIGYAYIIMFVPFTSINNGKGLSIISQYHFNILSLYLLFFFLIFLFLF